MINKVHVVGFKNEGFFKIPIAINKDGAEINLYRPKRIIKKELD